MSILQLPSLKLGRFFFVGRDRTNIPFIQRELPWEKSGQYQSGTTFIEGLVLFKNRWFLYYGCADTFVGVATAPMRAGQMHATR